MSSVWSHSTGFISPTAYENSFLAFFAHLWIETTGNIIWGPGGYQTVKDFPGSLKGTVVGAKVKIYDTWETTGNSTVNITISNDGGSSFSSALTTDVTGTNEDYVFGTRSELWGLNWDSFNGDISKMKVKCLNTGGGILTSEHVQIELFYRKPPAVRIEGSSANLKSAKVIIK